MRFSFVFSLLVLNTFPLFAGEASGGGVPEIDLARCEQSVHVLAPIGEETTRIRAYVIDKDLVSQPITVNVGFSFTPTQVHFAVKTPGAPKDGFYLAIDREPSEGIFPASLTVDGRTKSIRCARLSDHFRPLPNRTVNVEFRHGGRECFNGSQCIGQIGGALPEKSVIPMTFNVKSARLEGKWLVERELFQSVVVFSFNLSWKRGESLVQELSIALKDHANPTTITLEGSSSRVEIQTPALPLGSDTLSVWQRAQVVANP